MNRHLKLAIFIAPFLAVGSYVMTGYFIAEEQQGENHGTMRLAGSCLPNENACLFVSSEVELKLISNEKQGQQQLAIISTQDINSLSVGLGQNGTFKQFSMMKTDTNRYWQIKLEKQDTIKNFNQVRMAFTFKSTSYFAQSEIKL